MPFQRVNAPDLESDLMRDPRLGFEPRDERGVVRCLEHGFPTPLARWHYHDEYEIQLILESRGKAFIGDHVGNFEPGHLVLTGPRLPHNWITTHTTPHARLANRLVIQFLDAPLRQMLGAVPELGELERLLSLSRRGLQFFDLSGQAEAHFYCIRNSRGPKRFAAFLSFLSDLAASREFRVLSTAPVCVQEQSSPSERLNRVLQYVNEHYMERIPMDRVYELAGVSQSTFARGFVKATGMSFTAFVNQVRIAKAVELLMHTDQYVAEIAYAVGFNNLANFNRQFSEAKKMTPSVFRRVSQLRLGHDAAPHG